MMIAVGRYKPSYDSGLPEEDQTGNRFTYRLATGMIDDTCFDASCRVYTNEAEALAGIINCAKGISKAPNATEREEIITVTAEALIAAMQEASKSALSAQQLYDIWQLLGKLKKRCEADAFEAARTICDPDDPFSWTGGDNGFTAQKVVEYVRTIDEINQIRDVLGAEIDASQETDGAFY